jgi:thiosulfate/3-mercaptopyruvate sulfurtransferase
MTIAILTADTLRTWLAGTPPACTVIDARTREEFLGGHIPGALWLGWEDWCAAASPEAGPLLAQAGYWGVLAGPPALLARRLAAQGVRGEEPLVVYADGPRSRGREGRIAWMLLYLGATEVYLLDGGWRGWQDSGSPVETGEPRAKPGYFRPAVQAERRARFSRLKAAYQAGAPPIFVDARCQAEFAGDEHAYMPRSGRLPGAVLIPFAALFDEHERYVGSHRYQALVPTKAQGTSALVTYCEVGVRASLLALLHEIHTGQVVAVFDGSLMQWSLDPELPVCGRAPHANTECGCADSPPTC